MSLGCTAPEVGRVEDGLTARDGELVLDRRDDGATLLGRVQPVPENSDAERVLVLRTEGAGQPLEPALEGMRVLDARFAADRIVILGVDHVLRAWSGASAIELDTGAQPPLSIARSTIAYVRGEMPFFELARADAIGGTAEQLTQGMAPAWSPALSPDAREVVFVSSAGGSPRLHRFTASGTIVALPPVARFPSSPIAPRWEGDRLHIVDERGAATIELSTGRVIEGSQ